MSAATVEGTIEIAKSIQKKAEENFIEYGFLTPVTFVFLRKNWQTGEVHLEPQMAIISPATIGIEFGDEGKDVYSEILHVVLKNGNGIAIINLMECWTAHGEDGTEDDVMAWYQEHGTFKDYPGRKEKAVISIEHEDLHGGAMWMAEILRPEGEPAHLGPWVPMTDGNQMEGRFFGFFNEPVTA